MIEAAKLPKLVDASVVADYFGVTTATVNIWVRQGTVGGVKLPGGQCRVFEEDLLDMLGLESLGDSSHV